MLITTKDSSTLVSLDVERFSGTGARSFLDSDLDRIIFSVKALALENKFNEAAARFADFIAVHHASTLKSAIWKSKEILRKSEKGIAISSQSGPLGPASGLMPLTTPNRIVSGVGLDISQGVVPSGGGSQVGRSSQGTALTGGTSGTQTLSKKRGPDAATTIPLTPRPKETYAGNGSDKLGKKGGVHVNGGKGCVSGRDSWQMWSSRRNHHY